MSSLHFYIYVEQLQKYWQQLQTQTDSTTQKTYAFTPARAPPSRNAMTTWLATHNNTNMQSQEPASAASAEAIARKEEQARVNAKNELMVNAKKLFEESASQVSIAFYLLFIIF